MGWLREHLETSPGLKAAAVIGAILLWTSFAGQPLSDATFEASVHYVNVPENLELNPDQADRVTVILHGPASHLNQLRNGRVRVEADFSDVYGPGEKTLTVAGMNLGLPDDVRLVKAVPSQLRFTLEAQARREVEVQPQFVGSYEREYALASVQLDPPELVVVGPESRVALVDVVSTDPIDLTDVVGGRSFRVTAYMPDPYLRFAQDPTVTVEVKMRKRE
jgi:YbbR domain-containing protein